MNKYTINKVFERKFSANIWKLEVDSQRAHLAIETRDLSSTEAFLSVLNFDGTTILSDFPIQEKDWAMDSIQSNFVIFKKIGENTPIKEGILILDLIRRTEIFRSYEYSLIEVFQGVLKVKHRMFASGGEEYIEISSGQKLKMTDKRALQYPTNDIIYPIAFTYQKPDFLNNLDYDGDLWWSKSAECYLWSYHQQTKNGYELKLCVSDLNHILANEVILGDLEKQIPQPYFQVGRQLFLMTYNKQEIVSYLV